MNALVGLSFSALSSTGNSPLVQTLRDENQLPNPVFGFKLKKRNAGEVPRSQKLLRSDVPTRNSSSVCSLSTSSGAGWSRRAA